MNSSGGALVTESLTGNDGVVVFPIGNNINVVGLGSAAGGSSTAGNIYTTGNAGTATLTIHESQAQALTKYVQVSGTYAALASDYYISVSTALVSTIQLPNAPATGRIFVIKDRTGSANANNITITTVGGAVLIDGAASQVINVNYGSATLAFNGTSYEIY